MSITEELRDWSMDAFAAWIISRVELDALHAIADRIEAEHAEAVEQAHADGLNEQIDYFDRFVPSNYVLLPVDADGVPIHVGDELTNGEDLPSAVCCMLLRDGGWTVASTALYGFGIRPSTLRHVQPDSWERIMDDAEKLARGDNAAVMELVERCRRLAHDGR